MIDGATATAGAASAHAPVSAEDVPSPERPGRDSALAGAGSVVQDGCGRGVRHKGPEPLPQERVDAAS